jgi:hypothetical protein
VPAWAVEAQKKELAALELQRGSQADGGARPAPPPAAPARHAAPPPPVDHPVLDVLRQRMMEGSRPGARGDRFKLGLVVEGGGMRGIVTGARLGRGGGVGLGAALLHCCGCEQPAEAVKTLVAERRGCYG